MQRDSGLGDGYLYDYTQEITSYQQNGTVNLGTGTVTNPATTNNMFFDGCGNRTTLNGVPQTFDNMNQLSRVVGVTEFDPKGNLWKYGGWTYTYDAQNRLTQASNITTTALFYYDAKNRQIARSIGGVFTFSVWDDWELIEEYAAGNIISAKYLQGAHGPIKNLLSNNYYYQDSLGSTSHIASSTGALLEYYKYDLNGKPTYWNAGGTQISASAYGIRDLFTGERYVTELGLYDLRNRYYAPDTGRFLQPDPIGFIGDASNLYRYCGNDWANKTDPMGLLTDLELAKAKRSEDFAWAIAKNFDRSNILQGNFTFANLQVVEPKGGKQKTQKESPYWHDPNGSKDGCVPMSPQLRQMSIEGTRWAIKETQAVESHRAVWVDPATGRLMHSTYRTEADIVLGGQRGYAPPPKDRNLRIAADLHAHTAGHNQISGDDYHVGNSKLVPMSVGLPNGQIYIYRARLNANPNSFSMDGIREGPYY